jgi:hypothetical protein
MRLELPDTKEKTEQERKDYCSIIFSVFPTIEKDIKEKMYEQLIKTYSIGVGLAEDKAKVEMEVVRGNGKIEGMAELLEHWRLAFSEHQSPPDKDE